MTGAGPVKPVWVYRMPDEAPGWEERARWHIVNLALRAGAAVVVATADGRPSSRVLSDAPVVAAGDPLPVLRGPGIGLVGREQDAEALTAIGMPVLHHHLGEGCLRGGRNGGATLNLPIPDGGASRWFFYRGEGKGPGRVAVFGDDDPLFAARGFVAGLSASWVEVNPHAHELELAEAYRGAAFCVMNRVHASERSQVEAMAAGCALVMPDECTGPTALPGLNVWAVPRDTLWDSLDWLMAPARRSLAAGLREQALATAWRRSGSAAARSVRQALDRAAGELLA